MNAASSFFNTAIELDEPTTGMFGSKFSAVTGNSTEENTKSLCAKGSSTLTPATIETNSVIGPNYNTRSTLSLTRDISTGNSPGILLYA